MRLIRQPRWLIDKLPEAFLILRRLMEARMGKKGKREFVQVLRLLEIFQIADVEAGIQSALERGTIGFDAVKHLVLCRIEPRPSRLDMTVENGGAKLVHGSGGMIRLRAA